MLMPNRHSGSENYRYGFQNQEKDDEVKGTGNSVNYKYRMHDPRLGRFFAVDPINWKYPHYSPYSFSGNKVIAFVELEGMEEMSYITRYVTVLDENENSIVEARHTYSTLVNQFGAGNDGVAYVTIVGTIITEFKLIKSTQIVANSITKNERAFLDNPVDLSSPNAGEMIVFKARSKGAEFNPGVDIKGMPDLPLITATFSPNPGMGGQITGGFYIAGNYATITLFSKNEESGRIKKVIRKGNTIRWINSRGKTAFQIEFQTTGDAREVQKFLEGKKTGVPDFVLKDPFKGNINKGIQPKVEGKLKPTETMDTPSFRATNSAELGGD